MSKIVVHMIGQAHLDPVWLWRWTEGRAEAIATSQSAVDRLDEYPDFQFVRGEAQIYAWIQQEDPALFARIRDYIAQGRWHAVNGMVIQPDMNLPSGESLVRQVLLGKRVMRELLGVEPRVAYCVDSFDHAATLPQILSRCGFDSYVFMRPGPHEKVLPSEVFWWQGPDGSRVLAFRIAGAYQTRMGDHTVHIDAAVQATPPQLDQTMCFFGVGNHGGGPTKQQIENVQAIAATRDDLAIRFSSPADYFAAVMPQANGLPVVNEELQFHAVGCYAAVSNLKRAHRQAENQLLLAERMTVLAAQWTGRQIPAERLRELWNVLCFNQFHDILGGSATKEASDDAVLAFGHVAHSAAAIADDAGRAVAAQVDTRGAGGAVVLFNPFAEAVKLYIEYEPWTGWQPWDAGDWGLLDEAGQPVAYQQIEPHEALSAARGSITRLVFAANLPPLGYHTYRFGPGLLQADAIGSTRATPTSLENDKLALTLDLATGAIISCTNKRSGLDLVGPGGWNVPQVLKDTSDTWSHGIRSFDGLIGRFGDTRVTVCDRGPLQASLLVERRYEGSIWVQQLVLRHGEDELLIRNWLVWQGHWRTLKLAFDLATDAPEASHDIPFGWCARPCDGAEVPTQMWMDVSGPARGQPAQRIGAALLNDGKYGCDIRGSTMRLTVLRSPPYAYHIPHSIGTRSRYDWVDQGAQEWTLVLRPHIGDWRDSDVVSRARALNMPPLAITSHSHPGARPLSAALLTLESPELELTALKQADDGTGYIVRVADRHGRGGQGVLHWEGQTFSVLATPFEVVTLRLERTDASWTATTCDMLERSA